MEKILLGTYTRKTSEGIYQITLNKDKEVLENLELIAKAENPTYLEYDKDTHILYSVYQEGQQGGIGIYNLKNQQAKLEHFITQEGASPCYVHYDSKRDEITDANYHKGTINVYKNKKIIETFQYPKGAHAHFVHTHPKTGALYTVDLGNDTVHKYIDLKRVSTFTTDPGMGPRHLVFHPTAPYLYVFTELSNDLIVLKDGETLQHIQTLNALKDDEGKGAGAAIRISKDGKFIYVSNRGHDSITVYAVHEDFTVTLIQNISTHGEHPRDFNLSLDEDYVVVANRDTNNLVLFRRDTETGYLTYLNADTHAPEVVNVVFIEE